MIVSNFNRLYLFSFSLNMKTRCFYITIMEHVLSSFEMLLFCKIIGKEPPWLSPCSDGLWDGRQGFKSQEGARYFSVLNSFNTRSGACQTMYPADNGRYFLSNKSSAA
jgi:hypothetical protein